jgi:hypothetical protein
MHKPTKKSKIHSLFSRALRKANCVGGLPKHSKRNNKRCKLSSLFGRLTFLHGVFKSLSSLCKEIETIHAIHAIYSCYDFASETY